MESLGDNDLTLNGVKKRLLGQEVKQLDSHQYCTNGKPNAFVAEKDRTALNKFIGKCHRCGKKGHMKDCWQKNHSEANSVAVDKRERRLWPVAQEIPDTTMDD